MDVESVPLRREINVFYPRRHGVLITENWLYADNQRFAVSGLEHMWETGGRIQAGRRAALEVIAAEVLLVIAVVAVITIATGPSRLVFGLGGLDLGFALALVGLSSYRWPRPHELWGTYHGRPTRLYSSPDTVEFHKVCRAARRAVDYHRDKSSMDDRA